MRVLIGMIIVSMMLLPLTASAQLMTLGVGSSGSGNSLIMNVAGTALFSSGTSMVRE